MIDLRCKSRKRFSQEILINRKLYSCSIQFLGNDQNDLYALVDLIGRNLIFRLDRVDRFDLPDGQAGRLDHFKVIRR
jgi:hypothetical protein